MQNFVSKKQSKLALRNPYCTVVIEKKRCENICVYSYQQYRKEELRQFKNFIEFLKSMDLALFMPGPEIKNSTKNLQLIFKLKKLKLHLKKHLLQMPMFVYLCMKIELISNIMICQCLGKTNLTRRPFTDFIMFLKKVNWNL